MRSRSVVARSRPVRRNTRVVVASSGPPSVMMLTWANSENAAMVMVIRMKVRVPEPGPGHVQELLELGGPVQIGGLVELARDGLQPGEPDHHVHPAGLPDRQDDDREQGRVGIPQPVRSWMPILASSALISPSGWYMNSQSIDTTTIEVTTGRK